MLERGDQVPRAQVWTAPRQEPIELTEALAGDGLTLLCFYLFDWSPG